MEKEYRVKRISTDKQILQEETKNFFGVTVWRTIDDETIPTFASIQKATLGSTDWKSKFYDLPNCNFC
jgi:hypothetical protein